MGFGTAGATTSRVVTRGAAQASNMEAQNSQQRTQQGPESHWTDVWTQTGEGFADRYSEQSVGEILLDTTAAGALLGTGRGLAACVDPAMIPPSAVPEAMSGQWSTMVDSTVQMWNTPGVLAKIGSVCQALIGFEQMLSVPLSMIPYPALPALRILDMAVGLPHAHSHPPNLTPPNPVPVPLPSVGPIIPIPFISGAQKTLINGMPAARCGDMGLGVWCGGYFPMYEVFFGSSSVWIEGGRASRVGVDITKHCIFSSPKPQDLPIGPPIGFTTTASANVLIGGVPMPSLFNLALAAAFKGLFKGLGALFRRLRPAKAASEAAEAASHGVDDALPSPNAVDDVMEITDDMIEEITDHIPDRIDNILSDFNERVRDLVRQSPTLSRQLEDLDRAGWSISFGAGECKRSARALTVPHGSAANQVGDIAHEVGHAVDTPISPGAYSNSADYVDDAMRGEGNAQMNACRVQDEIAQNPGESINVPGQQSSQYENIYDHYQNGNLSEGEAADHMGNAMRDEHVGNTATHESYGDYYTNGWNNAHGASGGGTS